MSTYVEAAMRVLMALLVLACMAPAMGETPERAGDAATLIEQLHPEDRGLAEGWQDGLSALLDRFEENPPEFAVIDSPHLFRDLIAAEHLPFDISELEGNWRMRSLQASEMGVIAYPYFPSRIFSEARAMVFLKDSGSQRHQGMMAQLDDSTVLFVGALYYGYESPRLYSTMMAGEVTERQQEFDAVAEIYKIGEDHFLMAFTPRGNSYRLYDIRK